MAAVVVAALVPASFTSLDAAATPNTVSARLGLPSLAGAQRYILAPSSRTLRPTGVTESWGTDSDYVTAAQSVSETDAHDLQTSPESSTAITDGVTVRQAGPNDPGAWFSYQLHVPSTGAFTLRVEEAGAPDARYDVLVNGTTVYARTPQASQSGVWDAMSGLVHYEVNVPRQVVGASGSATVTFRNDATSPGPGARIAGVWALSAAPSSPASVAATQPYGGAVTNPSGALGKGTTTLSTNFFAEPYVIYDFGKEVGGTVSVAAKVSDGTPKLGFAFSESPQFMTTASDFSQDPAGVATETHYFGLSAGAQQVNDPVIRGGFRYLMVFLDSPGTVSLSNLTLTFTADPTNENLRAYQGAFLSSDDTLNRLWYSGAYSVQMASIDPTTGRPYPAQPGPVANNATIGDGGSVISDGAKRDRLIWGGDNAVSAPVSYLSTGESDPAANSIAFMAKGQFADGEVPGVYLPSSGYQASWGEYAAWWIDNYWTHYLYTGDRGFLDTYWPTLQGDVAWFETMVGADGLLNVSGGAAGHWGYSDSGEETYDNALYVYVLSMAAQAADVEGSALGDDYRADATRTAAAINANLWDATAGAYLEKPGDTAHPQDANAMAVLAGVATGARATSVLHYFAAQLATPVGDLTNDAATDTVPQYVSPFVTAQELGAYAGQDNGAADQSAMSLLRRTWTHMLDPTLPGTFWEAVTPSGGLQLGAYTSLSHGWSAAPTSYLTNDVLGVSPTSGGFATFQVLPHPSGGPTWAQGAVPTPHGDITAAWKQSKGSFQLAVSAPSGTSATVGVPAAGVSQLSENGHLVWRNGAAVTSGVTLRDGYLDVDGVIGSITLQATLG